MLFREIIAVYCESHTEHTLWEQNVFFASGTYIYHNVNFDLRNFVVAWLREYPNFPAM
jgi:hypothetical protein